MKKYMYRLFVALIAATVVVACSEEDGTTPGSDSKPAVTLYQYAPGKDYNSDNDTRVRIAANNKTVEAYYLAEKTADMEPMKADAYMDYVVSNGTKINEISGESSADVILTGMFGDYTITVVAVGKNTKTATATTFSGLDWADLGIGTFQDNWALGGLYEVEVQKAIGLERYRLVSPYKEGLANDDGDWADWLDGTSGPEFVEFWETSNDLVQFKTYFLGLNYNAIPANPVKAYYPSELSATFSVAKSKKIGDKEYQLAPYYYVDGVGGWNQTEVDGVIVITLP